MNDEGRIDDEETRKTQKGYDAYQDEGVKKQKELEARDQRIKEGARKLMDFGSEIMVRPSKPEKPTKMAKGGSVSSASSRADGCAQRGKTKGMIR